MACVENRQTENSKVWYLDSGCSNHMTGNKCLFSNLNENFRENVKLGNNSSIRVMGKRKCSGTDEQEERKTLEMSFMYLS